MKKLFIIPLVILVLSSLVFAGCTQDTTTTQQAGETQTVTGTATDGGTTTTTTGGTTTTTTSDEVIELRFTHHDPPDGPGGRSNQAWADAVEEATNGRVKVTMYPSASLVAGPASYDAVLSGIADVAWSFTGFYEGRFPLSDLVTQPWCGLTSSAAGTACLWNIYNKYPEVQAEQSQVKVITLHTHQGAPIGTKGVRVEHVEDLEGLKIRATAGGSSNWLKEIGANPMLTPPGDIYPNMEKGVIDGWTIDLIGAEAFNCHEVTDYYIFPYYYANSFFVIMNQQTWDSIPADIQQQIESVSGEWAAENIYAPIFDAGDQEAIEKMGITEDMISYYDAEDMIQAKEAASRVWDSEIPRIESEKGVPAGEIFDDVLSFFEQWNTEHGIDY